MALLPRRLVATVCNAALIASLAPTPACRPGKNVAGAIANNPSAADATGQAKCSVKQSAQKPLIIEWPGPERSALEGRAAQGLVAVRYSGCEIEILTAASVSSATYKYTSLTPRTERVRIDDFDELYANLPIGAAKLEAKLERSGQLNVEMLIVGRLDAPSRPKYTEYDLEGHESQLKAATHVVTGITVGAFQFTSGAEAEIGGGAEVRGVAGAGAKSGSKKEYISEGGNFAACAAVTADAASPPFGCGEMLRIELVPIEKTNTTAAPASTGTTSSGVLGLRDARPPADTGDGWTEQDERKLKGWRAVAYVGAGLFVLGGVSVLVGLLMNSRAKTKLADLGLDGDPSTPAATGSERVSAIRSAAVGQGMLIGGYVGFAVGAIMATIALPVAQRLKNRKATAQAALRPAASPTGAGATVEVRF